MRTATVAALLAALGLAACHGARPTYEYEPAVTIVHTDKPPPPAPGVDTPPAPVVAAEAPPAEPPATPPTTLPPQRPSAWKKAGKF